MWRRRREGGRGRFALTIRGRLMVLAVIAMVPLLVDRIRALETDRAERIEAASRQALMLARQGAAAQSEVVSSMRAMLQAVAGARRLLVVPSPGCNAFLSEVAD